ncbi:phage integrase N-terminal SAM-like domain-containing protein [Sphingopyxis terrae]|uniref:phage integrase N-terminal SAM-like domain-containing protein n=1 Tax=Sphingopyxis terrae TaxID=33052 RepID=UPI002A10349F|nr:phage integrase N-terminal SAM-like domain-containing protein [Sphingopyxis terrae]MDX8356455.1 phage integrase N-terminal SAM-like domain-containing protein [Sphingopyxis terrae]
MSPLRQRLIDDMTMRRFSKKMQRNYLCNFGRFATWPGRAPHTASVEDVRQFRFEQQQAGVPAPTMNSIVGALKFFFTHTLGRPDLARKRVHTREGVSSSGRSDRCRSTAFFEDGNEKGKWSRGGARLPIMSNKAP